MRIVAVGAYMLALVTVPACRATATPELASKWRTVYTPDSALAFRVPDTYREINAYGCWHRDNRLLPTATDFCLWLSSAEAAASGRDGWHSGCVPSAAAGDAECFAGVREDTLVVDGRQLLVVRALLSGTIANYRRVPAVLILIPFGPAGTAVLKGTHLEPDTEAELLAIASTVRPANSPSP